MTDPSQHRWINTLHDIDSVVIEPNRGFFSATHEEISQGLTTDVYFITTQDVLRKLGREQVDVVADVFSRRPGVFCGLPEILHLLARSRVELWSLEEGDPFSEREVLMRLRGSYAEFGIFETPLLGILAQSCAWATASRECREAAGGKTVLSFGARHVHPAVAPVLERAACIGGADGAACILGAKLAGREPGGTVPHAAVLIAGDTVTAARVFDQVAPPSFPRVILVDTFKDEAEESLRVAWALGDHLAGVRLDTPQERGGVTVDLVREIRERLDQAGYRSVKIVVSGGVNPQKIIALREYTDIFGVGSYISGRPPIDMTMDIKEIAGNKVAKRGRIPGPASNDRLRRVLP